MSRLVRHCTAVCTGSICESDGLVPLDGQLALAVSATSAGMSAMSSSERSVATSRATYRLVLISSTHAPVRRYLPRACSPGGGGRETGQLSSSPKTPCARVHGTGPLQGPPQRAASDLGRPRCQWHGCTPGPLEWRHGPMRVPRIVGALNILSVRLRHGFALSDLARRTWPWA